MDVVKARGTGMFILVLNRNNHVCQNGATTKLKTIDQLTITEYSGVNNSYNQQTSGIDNFAAKYV